MKWNWRRWWSGAFQHLLVEPMNMREVFVALAYSYRMEGLAASSLTN
jgi:hypothetical protein